MIHRRRLKLGVWPGPSCLPRETLFPHGLGCGGCMECLRGPPWPSPACREVVRREQVVLRSGLAILGRRMLCVGVIMDWLQKWP